MCTQKKKTVVRYGCRSPAQAYTLTSREQNQKRKAAEHIHSDGHMRMQFEYCWTLVCIARALHSLKTNQFVCEILFFFAVRMLECWKRSENDDDSVRTAAQVHTCSIGQSFCVVHGPFSFGGFACEMRIYRSRLQVINIRPKNAHLKIINYARNVSRPRNLERRRDQHSRKQQNNNSTAPTTAHSIFIHLHGAIRCKCDRTPTRRHYCFWLCRMPATKVKVNKLWHNERRSTESFRAPNENHIIGMPERHHVHRAHTHTVQSKRKRASETLAKIEGDKNKRKKEMEWAEKKEWMFIGGHGAT